MDKNLLGIPASEIPRLIPGLLVVSLLAWVSVWLSDYIGIQLLGFDKSPLSPVLMAILLGLAISLVVRVPKGLAPGLSFAVKKVLRLGIILLGIRLTIFDVFKLGAYGVPIVIICIASALVLTTLINRLMKLPRRLGMLIAVGTSICGVSAIVAAAPAIDAEEEEAAYAVAVITIFGLTATLAYPYLAHLVFAGDALKAGLFLGTAVHDTSQVVGAAKVYADIFSQTVALDVATVTKLVRNVFMALVIPSVAYYYSRTGESPAEGAARKTSIAKMLPLFVVGFLAMAVLRSTGDAGVNVSGRAFGLLPTGDWSALIDFIKLWAGNFLVVALAGVGLSTNFRKFKGLGIKPFFVGLAAAVSVGVVSYLAISLLGSLVVF